jgi:serine/threonine-protein kinase HipA
MEERYHLIAKEFGIQVFEFLFWKVDTLFIPRFDVQVENKKMFRFRLESMTSAMGISEFGTRPSHEQYTAFLKSPTTCRLSPLFDFAPMVLDSEGITRVCRWSDRREVAAEPQWQAIKHFLETMHSDLEVDWKYFFEEQREKLPVLKSQLSNWDLDGELYKLCQESIDIQLRGLK